MKEYILKIEAVKREAGQKVTIEQTTAGYSANDVRNIANENLNNEFKILKIEVDERK